MSELWAALESSITRHTAEPLAAGAAGELVVGCAHLTACMPPEAVATHTLVRGDAEKLRLVPTGLCMC